MKKIIAQGAEAIITIEKVTPKKIKQFTSPSSQSGWEGIMRKVNCKTNQNIITKNRIPKSYRLKELDDKLRKGRTKSESKILIKSNKIINTPKVIKTEKFQIQMQYIPGERLSETLNSKPEKEQIKIIKQIAKQISILHNNNIIHGDLTTSNTILLTNPKDKENHITLPTPINKSQKEPLGKHIINEPKARLFVCNSKPVIYIIDFGLGFISTKIEDKAVDIHLIKQALEAKHYQNWEKLYTGFLKSYNPKEKTKILAQLKKVESRGRYKH